MVKGDFDARSSEDFITNDISSLTKFGVIIGANLVEKTALEVSKYLFERNIPFVNAKFAFFSSIFFSAFPNYFYFYIVS